VKTKGSRNDIRIPTLLRVGASLNTPNVWGEPPDSSGRFFFEITPATIPLAFSIKCITLTAYSDLRVSHFIVRVN